MNATNCCLAVDLGGTKLLIGVVDSNGQILSSKKYPSILGCGAQQREITQEVLRCIDDFCADGLPKSVACVGAGLVGRVDPFKGLWLEIEPGRCETVRFAEILSSHTGLPCRIDNDVRCALRAERTLGFGSESDNFLYINVGTGIASGIVADGRVVRGASFNAGEVGHLSVDLSGGVPCPCGRVGCVEAIAAGSGLDRRARSMRAQYPDTRLTFPDNERCHAEEIFRLAREGDALCLRLCADASAAIASLIMNLCWVNDPDAVVLGGGVVADPWMFSLIRQQLLRNSMRFVARGVHLTRLNPNHVGLIGAALCGLQGEA